jgi:2-polyprenyl-3-methyl-5-hydroxy-6-metoxy-1,4-benzoquinol methylase
MPDRDGPFLNMHDLSLAARWEQPDRRQEAWYLWASEYVAGNSVLDVGAGSGYGMDIIKDAGAALVVGIDPLPMCDHILGKPVADFEDNSFDIVVAMDVIEHVQDDVDFLKQMVRVARKGVLFSTPNWNKHKCINPYHIREYTPAELRSLLAGLDVTYFIGDPQCNISMADCLQDDSDANSFGVLIRLG